MTGLEYVLFVKEVSGTKLAEELGVSSQLVHHWITGRRDIGGQYLEILEEKFGISAEYLKKSINGKDRIQIETLLLGLEGDIANNPFADTMVELDNLRKNYDKLLSKYYKIEETISRFKKDMIKFIQDY